MLAALAAGFRGTGWIVGEVAAAARLLPALAARLAALAALRRLSALLAGFGRPVTVVREISFVLACQFNPPLPWDYGNKTAELSLGSLKYVIGIYRRHIV